MLLWDRSPLRIAAALCLVIAPVGIATAQRPAAETGNPAKPRASADAAADLKSIRLALADQLPQVVISKAEALLQRADLPSQAALEIRHHLARASLMLDQPERAITALERQIDPVSRFWKAAALQQAAKYSAAEAILSTLEIAADSPLASIAKLNHAAVLAALGQPEKALLRIDDLTAVPDRRIADRALLWKVELLQSIGKPDEAAALLEKPAPVGSEMAWSYQRGRAAMTGKNFAAAKNHFAAALAEDASSQRTLNAPATLGLARAQRLQGEVDEAIRTLGTFLTKRPEHPLIDQFFDELSVCNIPPREEIDKLLITWAATPNSLLAARAEVSRLESLAAAGSGAAAVTGCAAFLQKYPNHPLSPRVILLQARELTALKRLTEAKAILAGMNRDGMSPALRRVALELEAFVNFEGSEYSKAAELFRQLSSENANENGGGTAAYQAALADILAGEISGAPPGTSLPGGRSNQLFQNLKLEQGLYAASRNQRDSALQLLKDFVIESPDSPRLFEGFLALAELQLDKPEQATTWLERGRKVATTVSQKEQIGYAELDLASRGPLDAYLKLADAFLVSYPDSTRAVELQINVGEVAFNARQFAEAKARFAKAGEMAAGTPEGDIAYFWAAKAALGSMAKDSDLEALKFWDIVAKGTGTLRHQARMEQAVLDTRRDPAAALQILDSILKDTPPPEAEMRYATLCLQGEILTQIPKPSPKQLEEAEKAFEAVIQAPGASVSWKQQAWFRRGVTLELIGNSNEALLAYHQAMEQPETPNPGTSDADYYWFFRAGEKALAMLERQKDWTAAVGIADRMAKAPGPLGEAARMKSERLKTEHLLWDEDDL